MRAHRRVERRHPLRFRLCVAHITGILGAQGHLMNQNPQVILDRLMQKCGRLKPDEAKALNNQWWVAWDTSKSVES